MIRSLSCMLLILSLAVGCGTKESSTPSASVTSVSESVDEGASQTVAKFMTAMLRGEDEKIRALLTPKARKVGEEKGVPFSPPASDTATFTIDKFETCGDASVSVSTTLTDVDPENGQKESSEIVWQVVKTEEGWRVSGALVALFEDQPKIQINFEDPEAAQQAIADAETREMQKLGNKPTGTENR